ncbi:MAG TPA: hypothetical protein VF240_10660 [Pyrinomonadaceae bacterium]
MYPHERALPQHYIVGATWLLLGLVVGLHFPDVDLRLQGLIPSRVLLHRSILTHGLIASVMLFWLIRSRRDAVPAHRLFVVGVSLAVAVHLCFDFFPRGWSGFALIHIPIYGRTTALFSQSWLILSIILCLYVAFLLVRNIIELALSIGHLLISLTVSAVKNKHPTTHLAVMLLALAVIVTVLMAHRVRKVAARRA